jgi:hypothetical protein
MHRYAQPDTAFPLKNTKGHAGFQPNKAIISQRMSKEIEIARKIGAQVNAAARQ